MARIVFPDRFADALRDPVHPVAGRREKERAGGKDGRCRMREGKRKPRRASSLSRSQRHRSGDQIGHLGPAAGLQSDIRRRYCARVPCSPITQLRGERERASARSRLIHRATSGGGGGGGGGSGGGSAARHNRNVTTNARAKKGKKKRKRKEITSGEFTRRKRGAMKKTRGGERESDVEG